MKSIELKGEPRKVTGKKDSKSLRKEEKTPCVLYGGKDNIHFAVGKKSLKQLVYTPNVYLVDLEIGKNKHKAIMKDLQFDPVTDEVLHIDFLEIFDDKPVVISIPVQLNGLAAGVRAGGKLQMLNRKLKAKGLSKDLPDLLEVDVTNLELGKSIKVGEVSFDNIELLDSKNAVIAAVKLTRAAKGMAGAEEAGEEAAEGTTGEAAEEKSGE